MWTALFPSRCLFISKRTQKCHQVAQFRLLQLSVESSRHDRNFRWDDAVLFDLRARNSDCCPFGCSHVQSVARRARDTARVDDAGSRNNGIRFEVACERSAGESHSFEQIAAGANFADSGEIGADVSSLIANAMAC